MMIPNPDQTLPGLPEMDAQHRYLFSLFELIDQSDRVADQAAAKALLAEIEGYLLFHLDSEEHLMRHYGYPRFAEHQSDHEAASARFVRFLDDFTANRLNPSALRIFLTGWLMEHGEQSDRDYAEWIKKCREKFFAGPFRV